MIIAQALTDATVDDAVTGADLIGAVDGDVASVTAPTMIRPARERLMPAATRPRRPGLNPSG